jgi:hypothetical protein
MAFPVGQHDDMLVALSRIVDTELQVRFPSSGWHSDKPPEVISKGPLMMHGRFQ